MISTVHKHQRQPRAAGTGLLASSNPFSNRFTAAAGLIAAVVMTNRASKANADNATTRAPSTHTPITAAHTTPYTHTDDHAHSAHRSLLRAGRHVTRCGYS